MTFTQLLTIRWLAVLAASLVPLAAMAQQPIAPVLKLPAGFAIAL
jgi:hypothetical protein